MDRSEYLPTVTRACIWRAASKTGQPATGSCAVPPLVLTHRLLASRAPISPLGAGDRVRGRGNGDARCTGCRVSILPTSVRRAECPGRYACCHRELRRRTDLRSSGDSPVAIPERNRRYPAAGSAERDQSGISRCDRLNGGRIVLDELRNRYSRNAACGPGESPGQWNTIWRPGRNRDHAATGQANPDRQG